MNFFYQLIKAKKRHSLSAVNDSQFRIRRLFLLLVLIIFLHTAAMVLLENMEWLDGFWLSVTTATTVGYGDMSASSRWGQLATFLLMYVIGISLLAQLASEYFENRIASREKKIKGQWVWKSMKDHVLIINTPKTSGHRYFDRLVKQFNITPGLQEIPVQIITTRFPDGLPENLQSSGVVHRHGRGTDNDILQEANVSDAKFVFIVARDEDAYESDSLTFDILQRIQHIGVKGRVIAEVVDDENRERFMQFGADAVLRPIRAYPELVVRAMSAPGTEQVLENLFTHEGDFAWRFDVDFPSQSWRELIERVIALDVGLPVGFVSDDGAVITNPTMATQVKGKALLLLANAWDETGEEKLQAIFAS